jgi:phospholipid/cholesterol/gamma-HCH transport system substrate-binding protein
VALAVAVLAAVVILGSALSGGGSHTLRASFEGAEQLAPGMELRMAGRKIGEIGKIETGDGRAIVDLEVREDGIWPLHRGTTAGIRWGSTTSLAYRYIELQAGPESAPKLPDNGLLTAAETRTPVELDESYRIFRGRTKGDLKTLVSELGDTLDGRGRALREGLRDTPVGLDGFADLLRELGADTNALRTLIVAGDSATSALASRRGDLGGLVDQAAATFDEFAQHARDQQRALDRAPRAFGESTSTLRRLDSSLVGLQALVDDLGPGARQLRALARPARRALAELRDVVPLATSTLRSGRNASPGIKSLLATGTDFLPKTGNVLGQLEPMFGCLRPYAPELAGNLATWTGYNKNFDQGGHYARTFPLLSNTLLNPGTSLNSQQITTILAGKMNYAMPRPPGLNAGTPWFQPQCGAGPESIDASKDPEGAGK